MGLIDRIVEIQLIINDAKQKLILKFVNDLKEVLHMSHPGCTERYLKKWEEKLK